MECKFSKSRNKNKMAVKLDGQEILKSKSFQNLGSIFHKDREIEEEVNHKIRARCLKCRSTSGVLYNHRLPIKLKEKNLRLLYN